MVGEGRLQMSKKEELQIYLKECAEAVDKLNLINQRIKNIKRDLHIENKLNNGEVIEQ